MEKKDLFYQIEKYEIGKRTFEGKNDCPITSEYMTSYKYYAKFKLVNSNKWAINTYITKKEAITEMERGKKGFYL